MNTGRLITGCLALAFLYILGNCSGEALRVESIYCENAVHPAGVSTSGFRFSWKLHSSGRNVMQTAYRIQVTAGIPGTFDEASLVWDSGRIRGGESILVSYAGPDLEPGTEYLWRVKVLDNQGNESAWSEPGRFIIGLETDEDWMQAEWIGYSPLDPAARIVPGINNPGARREWRNKPVGDHILPVLRKEFTVNGPPAKALVFVSGLGHYELRLNGVKVGDHLIAPGWTHYDETCQYNVYDITQQLQGGTNCLGMMLGNGFYIVPNARWRYVIPAYGNPKMILMLKLIFPDGSTEYLISDETWKTAPGPISFSSIYGGEDYNATLEQPGWDRPGFDDKSWKQALRLNYPSGRLTAEMSHPVKVIEVLEPVSVSRIGKGGKYLYDFGQNASGIVEIEVDGHRGDTVKLIPAELIRDNLEVEQRASGRPYFLQYILRGEGQETWSPRFTYYGFRYVQVEGAAPDTADAKGPRIKSLKMLHTRNAAPRAGEFRTSFELFNRIHSLILWAIRSNIQSVITDCPHREKLGWLEQTYLMGGSVHYNYDIYQLYCKVVHDMMAAQTEDGMVPGIAPEYTVFEGDFRDSPSWGSASVIVPWLVYRWYGDTSLMRTAWNMMRDYVEYLESLSEDHILSHGLGDWYDLGPERPGFVQLTPVAHTATAIYYYDLVLLGKMAALLGMDGESKKYDEWAGVVRQAFNERFFDPESGTYATGSQTAMAMPLVLGLVEETQRERVLSNLIDSIHASDNALTAGDVGFHFLLRALQDGGAGELIYAMNARDDVPGYGYQLKKGATALTESWPALRVASNNHLMLGHLMEWFYGGLAGIRQTEGSVAYREVLISPQPVGDIESACASFDSPYGTIRSAWERREDRLEMNVQIPVNCTAVVRFPAGGGVSAKGTAGEGCTIREGKHPLESVDGLSILSDGKDGVSVRIGSGSYHFVIYNP